MPIGFAFPAARGKLPHMKLIGLALVLLGLVALAGCEKDVREPGQPRVAFQMPR